MRFTDLGVTCQEELEQDTWSESKPTFNEGKLKVIGIKVDYHKTKHHARQRKIYAICYCSECAKDPELYGDGLFICCKHSLGYDKHQSIPCGCSGRYKYSKEQYEVRINRACLEKDFTFLGWKDFLGNSKSKIKLRCNTDNHEWETTIHSFAINGVGCIKCMPSAVGSRLRWDEKTILSKIQDAIAKDGFRREFIGFDTPDGHHKNTNGNIKIKCKICGITSSILCSSLLFKKYGCGNCRVGASSDNHCYINLISDGETPKCLKFGISVDPLSRLKNQNGLCIYDMSQLFVYRMPDRESCIKAEAECLKSLDCGFLTKAEMKDGYTETTHLNNLEHLQETFKSFGGELITL